MRFLVGFTALGYTVLQTASQAIAPSIITATTYGCTSLPGAAFQTCEYVNDTPVCLTASRGLTGTTTVASIVTTSAGSSSRAGATIDPVLPSDISSSIVDPSPPQSTITVLPIPQNPSPSSSSSSIEEFITLPVPNTTNRPSSVLSIPVSPIPNSSTPSTPPTASPTPSTCASLPDESTSNDQTFALHCSDDTAQIYLVATPIADSSDANAAESYQACLDACATYDGCVAFEFMASSTRCVVFAAGGRTLVEGSYGVLIRGRGVPTSPILSPATPPPTSTVISIASTMVVSSVPGDVVVSATVESPPGEVVTSTASSSSPMVTSIEQVTLIPIPDLITTVTGSSSTTASDIDLPPIFSPAIPLTSSVPASASSSVEEEDPASTSIDDEEEPSPTSIDDEEDTSPDS